MKKARISPPTHCRVTGEWLESESSGLGEWKIIGDPKNPSVTSLTVLVKVGTVNLMTRRGGSDLESQRGTLCVDLLPLA